MSSQKIKELRKAGKLEEALTLAKDLLQIEPDNIWNKRAIGWVFYDYAKLSATSNQYNEFLGWLDELIKLELPEDEKMIFDNLGWQIGKLIFTLIKTESFDKYPIFQLFERIKSFHFTKPSEGYTFIFKAFHKALKDSDKYIEFSEWWNLQNFTQEDFQKEKLPNGKEVISIAEQAYIAYAKQLLPKQTQGHGIAFNKEKAMAFLPSLSNIVDVYPQFQYPAYFHAKLLLAVGDKDNMLEALLPFAKKKQKDFWVWDILAEAFSNDPEKILACYCKALSCRSPEEMLVNLRQRMARLLISKKMYNEAKTEVELLVEARTNQNYNIPNEVITWQSEDWFKNAVSQKSNHSFYKQFIPIAEAILYSDIPEETVIVEFVNYDKKILNFIASEDKFGAFKYDRFLKNVKIGETLKIRFQDGIKGEFFKVCTVIKCVDDSFSQKYLREVDGFVRIKENQSFGFIDDIYIHPSIIKKLKLQDQMELKAKAIRSFNKGKNTWGWKLLI